MQIRDLDTEQRNVNTLNIDRVSTIEKLTLINNEDKLVADIVSDYINEIAEIVKLCNESLAKGGRIIYMGAGTSGRIAILDAVECPPTYGIDYETFIGLIAGGESAFIKAKEGAEDEELYGMEDLKSKELTENDVVIGIAASGRTPYVVGSLNYARVVGAKTVAIAFVKNPVIAKDCDVVIAMPLGAEVVTGSTRMKAGTATKLVLNMISTTVMINENKVYQNLMVDVKQSNKKLVIRAKNIIIEATGCSEELAQEALKLAEGSTKTAIIMIKKEMSYLEASTLLNENNGSVAKSLGEI